MPKSCAICGKKVVSGGRIKRRGMAKSKGGAGRKITGHSLRRFSPNIQRVKANFNGTVKTINICTGCLKAGKVQKAV